MNWHNSKSSATAGITYANNAVEHGTGGKNKWPKQRMSRRLFACMTMTPINGASTPGYESTSPNSGGNLANPLG